MSATDDPASGVVNIVLGADPIQANPFGTLGIRGFIPGTDGNISFTCSDGTSATAMPVKAGLVYPIRITKVTAFTGTGLTGLL